MNKLIIDTTDRKETVVKLRFGRKTDEIRKTSLPKSQNTLIIIEKLLKKNHLKTTDVDEVLVNTGPGSFTGTRVGVAIANALGFGLGIKVNGRKGVTPKYN